MSLHDSTVLVTGATGFVGGALVHRLAAEGANVRALVRSPHKDAYLRTSPHRDRITFIYGDCTDPDAMQRAVAGCDFVFHVAAALGGTLAHLRHANVTGTRTVLSAAAHTTSLQRIIHVSSIAVYGFGVSGEITESTPQQPGHAPYGISKREAERVVRQLATQHDLSYTIIRPGSIYGPRSGYWTTRLTRLAQQLLLPIPAHSQGTIPAIYIDDLLDLMILAATHPAAHNETFNATPTPSPTIRQYFTLSAGRPVRWLPIPAPIFRAAAALLALTAPPHTQRRDLRHIVNLLCNPVTYRNDRARQRLNWQPRTTLPDGIARGRAWLTDPTAPR